MNKVTVEELRREAETICACCGSDDCPGVVDVDECPEFETELAE